MDNDITADSPSPAEARRALSDLELDGVRLAERVVTPWWYYPTVGALVVLIVVTQALPSPASVVTLPVALFALPALVLVYRRRYGLWISQPAGPRSRLISQLVLVVFALTFAAMLVIKLTGIEYRWVLVPATVGFVAAVVLGPWYDDALRRELGGTKRADA
jgi:hypothetical protein